MSVREVYVCKRLTLKHACAKWRAATLVVVRERNDRKRSGQRPATSLRLEHVYGYSGLENVSPNLFYTAPAKTAPADTESGAVYYSGAVGVSLEPLQEGGTAKQHFFQGHDGEVTCLCMHPDRSMVATSQRARTRRSMAGKSAKPPVVCVWDNHLHVSGAAGADAQGELYRLELAGGETAVLCMGFSADGWLLATVSVCRETAAYTVNVWDWKAQRLVCSAKASSDAVYGCVWNPFESWEPDGLKDWASSSFVTFGQRSVLFWEFMETDDGPPQPARACPLPGCPDGGLGPRAVQAAQSSRRSGARRSAAGVRPCPPAERALLVGRRGAREARAHPEPPGEQGSSPRWARASRCRRRALRRGRRRRRGCGGRRRARRPSTCWRRATSPPGTC